MNAKIKVGREVITIKPLMVIGEHNTFFVDAHKVGKVIHVVGNDAHIEIYGMGKAIINHSHLQVLKKVAQS